MSRKARRGVRSNPFEMGELVQFKKEYHADTCVIPCGERGTITRVGSEYEEYRTPRAAIVYSVKLHTYEFELKEVPVNFLEGI